MDDFLSSSELRAILRFSLRASAASQARHFSPTTVGEPKVNPDNPALRPLIEQILFSRRFILTYYAAIGGIVALCTVLHLGGKVTRWRRVAKVQYTTVEQRSEERERGQTHPSAQLRDARSSSSSLASSSSSTLEGTQSPPNKGVPESTVDERTSLLDIYNAAPTLIECTYHRLKAFLMYQPAPIPAITTTSNILPDNGATLLVLLFLGLNIFYLFYHIPLSIPMLFAFADRASLCFVANLPILYLLSAKNNQPIKWLTGWSYEGLNIFHRRLGEWMVILALLHSVGMLGVWYTLLRPFHFTLLRFLSSKVILLGIFTFLSYVIIWGTSTGIVRKFYYEYFLVLHVSVQFAALVFLFFHHSGSRPYVYAALAISVIDRILLRLIVSPFKVPAELKVAADGETVLLFCDIPLRQNTGASRHLQRTIAQGWQPGQHVFVTVPTLGSVHKLQTHPFTIASPAPPPGYDDAWPLQLIIRAKDGFSKDLLNFAKSHHNSDNSVEILLDGPYGSNDTLESLRNSDRHCLVAGGSGIAVTYPYAWTLHVHNVSQALVCKNLDSTVKNVIGDFVNRSKAGIEPFTPDKKRFRHIWVKSSWVHQSWIQFWPSHRLMRAINDVEQEAEEEHPEQITVGNLLSWMPPTRENGQGRPDLAWELREWVAGEKATVRKEESICLVVSGPDGMVRDVRNTAAQLVGEGWNIEVHVEKFGW